MATDTPLIEYADADILRKELIVLRGVNMRILPGQMYYLTGRVGSGKSSLLKSIYGEVPIENAATARVLDFDLTTLDRKRDIPMLRRRIGIVFQDFRLLTDRSVYRNLEFVLRATGWNDPHEIDLRIAEVLRRVGMDKKSYKMPHQLSGGEQQRVVIARALLNKPAIILADEPTGNLDPETGELIFNLLRAVAREDNAAIIIATHNTALVDKYPAPRLHAQSKTLTLQ